MDIQTLELEIEKIKERNKKVEAEKAWETSMTRKIAVALFTYIVIVFFFLTAKLPNPFINAMIPSLAFLLSTLTMSFLRKRWLDSV